MRTLIYQKLPGGVVKITSPGTKNSLTLSEDEFEKQKIDGFPFTYKDQFGEVHTVNVPIQWMEFKRSDIGSHFQTDSGLTMDMVNQDGNRVLIVNDKQS